MKQDGSGHSGQLESIAKAPWGLCQETVIGNDTVAKDGGRKRPAVERVRDVPGGLMSSMHVLRLFLLLLIVYFF